MGFWSSWGKTRDIRCPDKTTRILYKNIDDACPLFIAGFKADITADIKGAEDLSGKVAAQYERDIKGLLFSLNEQNQSLMMSFRTVYLAYSTNPCGNDNFFQREIEKLLDEQRKISALKIKIGALIQIASAVPTNNQRISSAYREIAGMLGGDSLGYAASTEIAETRSVAQQILGKGKV